MDGENFYLVMELVKGGELVEVKKGNHVFGLLG